LFTSLTPVYVYRIGELEERLDNRDKEQREMKLKAEERIRMLEKKYVFPFKDKIQFFSHIITENLGGRRTLLVHF